MPHNEILERLHKVGLSDIEQEVFFITDEPKIPYFLCFPNDKAKQRYFSDSSFGQGYHPEVDLARIKSTAEFLERICLDNPQNEGLIFESYQDNGSFVDPGLFFCYSKDQISNPEEFKKGSRTNRYRWFPVTELLTGKQKFLPAQLIFLSRIFDDEFQIRRERISTGAALGKKGDNNALSSGLLEAIERDACIYSYLTKRNIPKIINFQGKIKDLDEYLNRYNLETYTFDATSNLRIPTIISIVIDRTGIGPAVEVGSASAFSYEEAIYKAILESIQCRRSVRLFGHEKFPNGPPREDEIFSLEQRFTYWHSLERIRDIEFWLNTKNKIFYNELQSEVKDIKSIIDIMKNRTFNIFVADITLPEISREGFEVIKIIIPELHPLYLDERAKALFSIHYGNIINNPKLKPHPLT